ncbi:MAG TPA: hypothetical protein H9717_09785 [Candidatus Eisenbergiella merdipullorum]|uniref:Carbohydrate-binding domain-containing protein n=1 Tax=Candidatus Eisenbergiella merdipullorum TaxID=2838553 RepID=A0A9D2I6S5_9FIRM|nr:hypothetical protein [Candidatus Eisenbergiella merdipullorum]
MKRYFRIPALTASSMLCAFLLLGQIAYGSSLQGGTGQKESGSREDEKGTGDFQVDGGSYDEDYSYQDGILTILTDTELTISGRVEEGGIITAEDTSVRLVFDGLTVNADGCALDIQGEEARIELEGDNTLTSGQGWPGIRVPKGSTLSVEGDADASLTVRGGTESAGIGAAGAEDFGTIFLAGGTVTASGGRAGAGIGAGSGGGTGKIEITGGIVKARGGAGAADVGNGAQGGSDSPVTLNGDAILEAEEITGKTEGKQGILIQGNELLVCGDTMLIRDLSLSAGDTLTIGEDAGLTVPQDMTVDNRGQIAVYGSLEVLGEVENTKGRIYRYEDGVIEREENIAGNEAVSVEEGKILLSQGDIVIQAEGYRQNGTLRKTDGGRYSLYGEEESTNTIKVEDGVCAVIEMDGTVIRASGGEAAFTIGENAQVMLILSGNNYLTAQQLEDALQVKKGAALRIRGTGTLTLQGSADRNSFVLEGGAGSREAITDSEEETEELSETENTAAGEGEVYEIVLDSGETLETGQLADDEDRDYLLTVTLQPGNGDARELTISRPALRKLVQQGASFRLETDYLSFEMDTEALTALLDAVRGDVGLRISPFSLSGSGFEKARALIGEGPVYDIQVREDVNGTVTARNVEFGSGKVKLEIPFEKTAASDGQTTMVYVGTGNLISIMEDTVYDSGTRTAAAFVPHFSVYGVAVFSET